MRGTDDILGHRRLIDRLWDALARDALHHAYLFEGPPGLGKRTVALRLAMAANCTGGEAVLPCGACPSCRQIAGGNHPDVLTVEPDPDKATPTIPVSRIREVVRQTGYHRFAGRRRFIVVDPAEAMGPAAANALLKTLEEPPGGTGFVLIATHASALLPTIVSRCQRVRFSAVPEDALGAWLETRGVADPAALARLARGCPGAALELGDGGLQARLELRGSLLDALGGDLGGLFAWSTRICEGGRASWTPRVEALLEVLEDLLRDVAVHASGSALPLVNADRPDLVEAWSGALWPTGLRVCERALRDTRLNLGANVNGRLLVETLLARVATELGSARRVPSPG